MPKCQSCEDFTNYYLNGHTAQSPNPITCGCGSVIVVTIWATLSSGIDHLFVTCARFLSPYCDLPAPRTACSSVFLQNLILSNQLQTVANSVTNPQPVQSPQPIYMGGSLSPIEGKCFYHGLTKMKKLEEGLIELFCGCSFKDRKNIAEIRKRFGL